MADLFSNIYNPDVLSCLANLSNDEVFTPPSIANQMLDLLPQELFEDPNTTFLDPCCKSGVFLREIARRLIVGLENKIPNLQDRLDNIFHKQIFGIAITELTSLLSRRSIYCSKYASSKYSVSHFDNIDVNIRFKRIEHTWSGNKCIYCGASKTILDRGEEKDTHAYEFIHKLNTKELNNMKFDVIIGNPPYQLGDGGGGAGKSSSPIYNLFVENAKKLNPRYLTMIIPSRWFSGGKGLNEFRQTMLKDNHISKIIDYEDSKDCFSGGVDIPGGICYFLWERNYQGLCSITNIMKNGNTITSMRSLSEFPILIRNNNSVSIVKKVTKIERNFLSEEVFSRRPFGIDSNVEWNLDGDLIYRNSDGLGKINSTKVSQNKTEIPKWKVIISKVSYEHAGVPDKDGMMRVLSVLQKLPPNSVCSESYLLVKTFDSEDEAENLLSYLKTKFIRFLMTQMLASMNMTKTTFSLFPIQDFSKTWTDEALYKKYGLIEEEIAFIESIIKPMNLSGDDNE